MNWMTEKPKETGWYWLKTIGQAATIVFHRQGLINWPDGSDSKIVSLPGHWEWYGPLDQPKKN
jgi:hypothetical protein